MLDSWASCSGIDSFGLSSITARNIKIYLPQLNPGLKRSIQYTRFSTNYSVLKTFDQRRDASNEGTVTLPTTVMSAPYFFAKDAVVATACQYEKYKHYYKAG